MEGAKNYAFKSNETLVLSLTKHIQLGNSQYVTISNPVCRDKDGKIQYESFGQVKLKWGEMEIRQYSDYSDPFPLYPGERLEHNPKSFVIVQANEQIQLFATQPFFDDIKKKDRVPGDKWMIRGPYNYIPRVEATIEKSIHATIVLPNQALKLLAINDCVDKNGIKRKAGEEWLHAEAGSYLESCDEKIVATVKANILTDKIALKLKAKNNFTDVYKKKRAAGEEWLVTIDDSDQHITDVNEEVMGIQDLIVLSSRQYCVIVNPVVDGKPQYGNKQLKRGEASFFLKPGEELLGNKISEVDVLDENEAVLLKAIQPYKQGDIQRTPGDRWMIKGPCEFVLPLELELLEKRKAIPLDENEGIYVRDVSTGDIKTISGQTYLLSANEELYYKEISPVVQELIAGSAFATAESDESGNINYKKEAVKTHEGYKVVTFRAPANSAVQVFDYKTMGSRIVFGPELVKLGPHEEFTVLRLSGKKPKIENQIVNLAILLGPDFMTDIIQVETRDHAKLTLQLSYSWKFLVKDKTDLAENSKLFAINDFVGNACKTLAAKIRGAVSTVPFETFHQSGGTIAKAAVFGTDENGKIKDNYIFPHNNLVLINLDIQSQSPSDNKTRENLDKLMNLNINTTNVDQKADAEHRQNIYATDSQGKLELQKLEDDTHAEKQNIEFLKRRIETEAVETTGARVATARAIETSHKIQGESTVEQSKLKMQALEIEIFSKMAQDKENILEDIKRREQDIDVEIDKLQKLTSIEISEFKKTVDAIGKETIVSMAKAGPQVQAKLLQSLGIKSFLISDGKSPINLFNTAKGIVDVNGQK
jgi:major vault protein